MGLKIDILILIVMLLVSCHSFINGVVIIDDEMTGQMFHYNNIFTKALAVASAIFWVGFFVWGNRRLKT